MQYLYIAAVIQYLLGLETMGVDTFLAGRTWPTLLAIQLVRWHVSLMTVGIINLFC